tara:strand:- start:10 stop:279 length:270 start_codon:yes stop_codon:yes gene_type:complete
MEDQSYIHRLKKNLRYEDRAVVCRSSSHRLRIFIIIWKSRLAALNPAKTKRIPRFAAWFVAPEFNVKVTMFEAEVKDAAEEADTGSLAL